RRRADAAAPGRGPADGDRCRGPHRARRRAILQFERDGADLTMARVLYFDCFSGISGDMTLGALLDAGLPFEELKRALGSLAVSGYEISAARVLRAGVSATKFSVTEPSTPAPQNPSTSAP